MTHLAEHSIACAFAPHQFAPPYPRMIAQPRIRSRDARWPALASALLAMRAASRRSIRIVDADCGAGSLLLCAVRHARALGFTAIEARGIDQAAMHVRRAQAAAAKLCDPAISVTFETGMIVDALAAEAEFPADIVLWHGETDTAMGHRVAEVVSSCGNTVIADDQSHPAAAA